MTWTVERIINFQKDKLWGQGHVHYGFHDLHGNQYFFHYFANWIGRIGKDDEFIWTAGARANVTTGFHINVEFEGPIFLTVRPDGGFLVSCAGNAKIFALDPETRTVSLFVDGRALGMKDIGSCALDSEGNIWASEITGCKIWCLDSSGRVVRTVGTGEPGFQSGMVPMDEARFRWIYVMQRGPDGHLYILDSANCAVRRLDLKAKSVETIVGTGSPGYSGNGGDARQATLGSAADQEYSGPYGMRVDEQGNLYIADTDNHVIRTVDGRTGVISTIAGQQAVEPHRRNDANETDPYKLNIPKAAALDYHDGRLFIPEWDGDLIVLRRSS